MKVSLLSCLFFSVVVGGLIIVFCKPLVSIFVGSGAVEVIRLSRIYNSIEASCLWCAALLVHLPGRGAGNRKYEDPDDGRIFGASHACFCSTLLKPYLGLSGTGNGLSAGVDICGTVKHVVLSKAGQK